jgi:hypothetical protein
MVWHVRCVVIAVSLGCPFILIVGSLFACMNAWHNVQPSTSWISHSAVTKYRFPRWLLSRVNNPYKMVISGGQRQRMFGVMLRVSVEFVSHVDEKQGSLFSECYSFIENYIHRISSLTLSHFLVRHKFSVILCRHRQFNIKVCYLTTLLVVNVI